MAHWLMTKGMETWAKLDQYEAGWFVGAELEDGSHTREVETPEGGHNWPLSIYRKGCPGHGDVVLCHGIQSLDDARLLCEILNVSIGGTR